jgi:hypothetical protein
MMLYLDDYIRSKNGKRIPLNLSNNEPHSCANKIFTIPCRTCGQKIFFDNSKVSKSGKKIPLDYTTGGGHDCGFLAQRSAAIIKMGGLNQYTAGGKNQMRSGLLPDANNTFLKAIDMYEKEEGQEEGKGKEKEDKETRGFAT